MTAVAAGCVGLVLAALPHHLAIEASTTAATVQNGHVFSWSKDGSELAVLRVSDVAVLDAATLQTRRTLSLRALALGEHCFAAVVEHRNGVQVVGLGGAGSVLFGVEAGKDGGYSLADDCRHLSSCDGDSGAVSLFDGSSRIARIDPDPRIPGPNQVGEITADGRFIAWSFGHGGGGGTVFQEFARRRRFVRGTFGLGASIAPGGRIILDTGKKYYGYAASNDRPRLVAAPTGRTLHELPFPRAPSSAGGDLHARFSSDGRLLALGLDRRLMLFAPDSGEQLAEVKLPGEVRDFSFDRDASRLAVTTAAGITLVRILP